MGTLSSGHLARKQELRELKLLQKIEQKQFQELAVKANFARQEQEKKFDAEKLQLLRSYDTEVESLNRQQKQQVSDLHIVLYSTVSVEQVIPFSYLQNT